MKPTATGSTARCPRCGEVLAPGRAAGLCVVCLSRSFAGPAAAAADGGRTLPAGFDFVETLGRGGMGTVTLVYQRELSRYVALKQLAGTWAHDERARERFLREARAAARLKHPGIVPILEIGADSDPVWYTMEFAEGGDLSQWLRRRGGTLPWSEAVALAVQIADAIGTAHAAGVAHRDLKPSNILLDQAGRPKISDFGLAWFSGHEGRDLTVAGEVLGTPAYLAPEVVSGGSRTADARLADLYAIGALLFHLVAGHPPFEGAQAMEVLAAIANRPTPHLSRKVAPAAVDDICHLCLAKDPAARFQSAEELKTALLECGGGRSRLRRRRPRRFGAARLWVYSALALAVGAAGFYQWSARGLEQGLSRSALVSTPPLIAVAPVEVVGDGETAKLLGDVLQDELVGTLLRITDLKVMTTRSSEGLNPAAAPGRSGGGALGAELVLYARVRSWKENVWIATRLIGATDGAILWSHTYTRGEGNTFNLQTDIVTDIALRLDRQLRPGARDLSRGSDSDSAQARTLLSRARRLVADASDSVGQLAQAEALLQRAVALDRNFALAYAQLSLVHTQMYNWGNDRTERRLALGLEAAQKALQINPDLVEGEVALGHYYFRGSRDYATARPHLERAVALSPHHPAALEALAHIERRQGFFAEAAAHFAAVLRLDPLNAILAYNTADTFLRLRDYPAASQILNQSLGRLPGHVALRKLRGDLEVAWHGDLGPMRDDIAQRNPKLPTPDAYLFDKIEYLTLARQPEEALRVLRASKLAVLEGQSIFRLRAGYEALLLQAAGNADLARARAVEALVEIERQLGRRPNDARILMHAAQMYALAGDLPRAEQFAARIFAPGDAACVDAFDRGIYRRERAIMLAGAGAADQAREAVRLLLREPNQTSVHYLRLHPLLAEYSRDFP